MSQHAFVVCLAVMFSFLFVWQPVGLWLKLRYYRRAADVQKAAHDATVAMQKAEYRLVAGRLKR